VDDTFVDGGGGALLSAWFAACVIFTLYALHARASANITTSPYFLAYGQSVHRLTLSPAMA